MSISLIDTWDYILIDSSYSSLLLCILYTVYEFKTNSDANSKI